MNQFPDLPAGSNFELDLELADLSSLPDIPLQQMDIDVGFLKFQTDLKRLIATLPRLSAPALDLRASKTDINFASDFPGAATAPGFQPTREANPASLARLASEFRTSFPIFDAPPLDTVSFVDEVNSLWPANAASLPDSNGPVSNMLLQSTPPEHQHCSQVALQPSGKAASCAHSTRPKQPLQSGFPQSVKSDVHNNIPPSLYGPATCDTSAAVPKEAHKVAVRHNNTPKSQLDFAMEAKVHAAGQHKRQKRKARDWAEEDSPEQQTKKARKLSVKVEPTVKEGEVVWAKHANYPHWPAEGQVCDPTDEQRKATKHTDSRVFVCFFDQGRTIASVPAGSIQDWNIAPRALQQRCRNAHIAAAVEHVNSIAV